MKPITPTRLPDHGEATSIDPMALSSSGVVNDEFCRLPSDMAYWSGVYADAIGAFLAAKASVKNTEGRLYLMYRATQTPDGKSPSEKYVDACINTDAAYLLQIEQRDLAEVQKVRVGGLVDAIGAKREALVTIGANIRREMESLNFSLNRKAHSE